MPHRTDEGSLHEACYQGNVERVRALLARGADPNAPAEPGGREWASCAGSQPRPLNCVAIAWRLTEGHVQIARLLIEHGAVADDTVFQDHAAETMLGTKDLALHDVLLAGRRPLADPPMNGS